MIHLYINNYSENTLIMLHGTGADENDLIPLAEVIDPKANILSIRGNVNENGMNRFFKRVSMGVYDIPNFILESKNLAENITKFSKKYNFKLDNATVVGFSNGANIAQGLIQDHPEVIKNFILLSPAYINPNKGISGNLDNHNIFISAGIDDPYASFSEIENLIDDLEKRGATVDLYKGRGHRIEQNAVLEIIEWHKHLTT